MYCHNYEAHACNSVLTLARSINMYIPQAWLDVWVATVQNKVAVSEVCEGDPSLKDNLIHHSVQECREVALLACGFELCHMCFAAFHCGTHTLENNVVWVLSVLVGNLYFSAGKCEGKGYWKKWNPVAIFMTWRRILGFQVPGLIFLSP